MRKKINNSIDPDYKKILKQDMTTRKDLEFLAQKLNIPNLQVNWVRDYIQNPDIPQILNLGNNQIQGTHWISTYKGKYFDPFGLPPPNNKLKDLEWVQFHIQDQKKGGCGQYCLLWIYYMMIGEEDQFYNMFCME